MMDQAKCEGILSFMGYIYFLKNYQRESKVKIQVEIAG
jgi:hypothetical protein